MRVDAGYSGAASGPTEPRWPWLVFLPLYFAPWAWKAPAGAVLAAACVGNAAVLVLFIRSVHWTDRARLRAALSVFGLSFTLAFAGGMWAVVTIYAVAIAGEMRPSRHAVYIIGLFVLSALVFGTALAQPLMFWLPGVFMMGMIGLATVTNTALKDKNSALTSARDEVRRLAISAERERIGRDLHDLLGRTLTLVALKADLSARLASGENSKAEQEMREVAQAARAALAEVRAAVSGMVGTTLTREIEAAKSALDAAGITCSIAGGLHTAQANSGAVLAMVLREAVTNVIRHSRATSCHIDIAARGTSARLVVVDDGNGKARLVEGGGLEGLRARLELVGGILSIEGDVAGTQLTAVLPNASSSGLARK